MHCAALEGEDAEPHEVFVALGVLIVEGRVPGASERGYGEGPHCPSLGAKQRASPHLCDHTSLLCRREVEFRKRMLLLWQSGVPMSVEVLACPDCPCGAQRAQSHEPTVRPSPSDLLLEQWTITAQSHRGDGGGGMGVRALLQAVRSQLFFSQLGAWLSSSGGRAPHHICYRLTVPGEAFASQFQRPPTEHSFPIVRVGRPNNRTSFQVSLKSLPRGEGMPPRLPCCRGHETTPTPEAGSASASTPTVAHACKENCGPSPAQRKGVELLGESLLDPPQRRGGGRYQSPSQRASPVLDTPDLLFRSPQHAVDGIVPEEGQNRVGRQGLARRRDVQRDNNLVVDDRMHTECTLPGKHHCCAEEGAHGGIQEEDETAVSQIEDKTKEEASSCSKEEDKQTVKTEKDLSKKDEKLSSKLKLSQREVEEVLAVLRYRARPVTPPLASSCEDGLAVNVALSKGAQNVEKLPTSLLDKETTRTKLPSLETSESNDSTKAERLLQAILRPSKQHAKSQDAMQVECSSQCSSSKESSLKSIEFSKKQVEMDTDKHLEQGNHSSYETNYKPAGLESLEPNLKHLGLLGGASECNESHKPSGLERLKHLFNKTISVPSKDQAAASIEGGRAVVPSALDKAQFRRSLDSAASMVFRSGLPLTSSPAPVRRGTRFDFDSSINSVQAIRSALFESTSPVSPCASSAEEEVASPDVESPPSPLARATPKPGWSPTSGSLLGTFEESVLNGRLEPVSTVHGFTAELGASGSFCPKHARLPVTVFFYTLGDNDKVSTPYLGHINLGKKGYNVPRCGTVQVTLFNPLGTVVKMFVVAYDLSDMPPNSQTFLRQRTLYLPTGAASGTQQPQHLRYLIHLRFSSSKSGRIFLHSDVRMIIFRKSDQDTASAHAGDSSPSHELRSFLSGPSNPKFSPRK